jgi:hypothetical protein
METYEETLKRMWIKKHIRLAKAELLLRLLAWRFGAVPGAITRRVTWATGDEVERWAERLLDAASLDDVFAAS